VSLANGVGALLDGCERHQREESTCEFRHLGPHPPIWYISTRSFRRSPTPSI
jgi:hypothetical protein